MTDYYNTNDESGDTLGRSQAQGRLQEQAIEGFFRQHPCEIFAPHEVHERFPQWPLTSIRRAMTNLTTKGILEKTDAQVQGTYGKSVYTWRLRQDPLAKIRAWAAQRHSPSV